MSKARDKRQQTPDTPGTDTATGPEPAAAAADQETAVPAEVKQPPAGRDTVKPQTPAKSAPSNRWLVAQATATLESVAAQNYVCYSGGPVPRYPVQSAATPRSDPAVLCVELRLCDAQAQIRLAILDQQLTNRESTAQQSVWIGYNNTRQVQIVWIWDFYRIQSHLALRAALPPVDSPAGATTRQAMLDTLRALAPGDLMCIDVQSPCGAIHQQHTLAQAAVEWTPANQPPVGGDR
ncbi:MAG: hypothetical protein JXJ20_08840 [Anaerolineae bacterium]|nr:hypothetical protein [Anaerolineae bacterium]